MCRNIHPLFNYTPAATEDEIRGAALQFVRKISGFTRPSRANEAAFARAVDEVAQAAQRLLEGLTAAGAPRDRAVEAARARSRAARRFGPRSPERLPPGPTRDDGPGPRPVDPHD